MMCWVNGGMGYTDGRTSATKSGFFTHLRGSETTSPLLREYFELLKVTTCLSTAAQIMNIDPVILVQYQRYLAC